MDPSYCNHLLLAFGLTAVAPRCSLPMVYMTAGSVGGADSNKTPVRPPEHSTPPTKRIETRPEVVGGLPLWLSMGFAGQVRRFTEMLDIAPFATMRRNTFAKVEQNMTERVKDATESDLPVGRALRKIADIMEEEVTALRIKLSTMRSELQKSQNDAKLARKQLLDLKARSEWMRMTDSEHAVAMTSARLNALHMKEQTRATAAEKKLRFAMEKLERLEKGNAQLQGDLVKLSVLYSGLAIVVFGYIIGSPVLAEVMQHMVNGGH